MDELETLDRAIDAYAWNGQSHGGFGSTDEVIAHTFPDRTHLERLELLHRWLRWREWRRDQRTARICPQLSSRPSFWERIEELIASGHADMGTVYLAQAMRGSLRGLVKIGHCKPGTDPTRRLARLPKCGLVLARALPGPRKLEIMLHNYFWLFNAEAYGDGRTEWFLPAKELVQFIG